MPLPLRRVLILVPLLVAPSLAAREEPRTYSPACTGVTGADTILSASREGEIALTSGLLIRLLDLRLSTEPRAASTAASWLGSLVGSTVLVSQITPADRWGRVAASLAVPAAAPLEVAELLVGEGLAIVDPGQRDVLCRADLLAVEAAARHARRGLWSETAWPLRAESAPDLEPVAGTFAVVQGRVLSVGERRERTYLNFGRDWSKDFSVTIPRRIWRVLKERGIDATTLRGREVRVRGIIEVRRGPTLELTVPETLELADAVRAPRP